MFKKLLLAAAAVAVVATSAHATTYNPQTVIGSLYTKVNAATINHADLMKQSHALVVATHVVMWNHNACPRGTAFVAKDQHLIDLMTKFASTDPKADGDFAADEAMKLFKTQKKSPSCQTVINQIDQLDSILYHMENANLPATTYDEVGE